MNARERAQYRWDHVAKPLHSLGRLEKLIVQIAGIQQTEDVRIDRRCALVFCADHGVVAGQRFGGAERKGIVPGRDGHGFAVGAFQIQIAAKAVDGAGQGESGTHDKNTSVSVAWTVGGEICAGKR